MRPAYFKPKRVLIALALTLSVLFVSDRLLNMRTQYLIDEKYTSVADEARSTTKALIEAKSEAVLFIALSLAHDQRYLDAIANASEADFELDQFANELSQNTNYKNIWIQVSDYRGISLYRSWTKKRGDDLSKVRTDMAQMVKEPKIQSTISTGIFDMTFKAMVPIFKDQKFMGTIEVIAKFNSIAEQLLNRGLEPVMLVDKSYREQITKPFTKMFVGEYYVANLNASAAHREYIKNHGIEKLLHDPSRYIVDRQNNLFITKYVQKDVNGRDMGYFILFHPLDAIDLGYIHFYHNAVLVFITLLALGVYMAMMLIAARYNKEKTELQNRLLSQEVEAKNLELEEQHEFLQSVMNGVNESVMVIDKEYNVLLANDYAKKFMDSSMQNVAYPKCYELSHRQNQPCGGDHHPCPLAATFEQRKSVQMVHRHTTRAGKVHYVELTTTPLYNKQGELYAIVEMGHDITEHLRTQKVLEAQKDELDYQAHYDALTSLPNRVLFFDRLERSIENAKRYGYQVALIFIDLDHFKEINDSLGHDAGDYILKETADRLKKTIRKSDTVSRLGGDEFTMILERVHNVNEIVDLVQVLLKKIKMPHQYRNNKLYCGASIGISICPDNGTNAQDLLRNADAAMYKAKASGRNTYSFYTQAMTERAYERVILESKLREAIKSSAFRMFYQPQVNIHSRNIVGLEALVRWFEPDGAIVPPDRFIPLSEQTGLIVDIGKIILESVFSQAVRWKQEHVDFKEIAVNISTKQLKDPDFLPTVEYLLKSTGCHPDWIEFEITESFIIDDIHEAVSVLDGIRKLGIHISMDDFGTGYSSLSYLKQLPINKLKIDKSFIDDIPDDESDKTITKAIISLAKNLNIEVIAEGVENEIQEAFLKENGCELAQGYLYAKPLPVEEVVHANIH